MLGSSVKDAYIAVVGVTGAGKTSFITTCTGKGKYLPSHTTEVEDHTFYLNDNVRVHLIDTPGLSDVDGKPDTVTQTIFDGLSGLFKQGKRFSGILLVHPLGAPVKPTLRPALAKIITYLHLCGYPMPIDSITLVESPVSMLCSDVGDASRSDAPRNGDDDGLFRSLRQYGSRVFSHDDTQQSALEIISHVLNSDQEAAFNVGNAKSKFQELSSRDASPLGGLAGDFIDLGFPELAELESLTIQRSNDKNGILAFYREEVKNLMAEIREGVKRQNYLAGALEEAIDYREREYEQLTLEINKAKAEQEQEREQHARALAEKEKTTSEALARAKNAQVEMELLESRLVLQYTTQLRDQERTLREEKDKAVGDAKVDAQAELDRVTADLLRDFEARLQDKEHVLRLENANAVREEGERIRTELDKEHRSKLESAREEDALKAQVQLALVKEEMGATHREELASVKAQLEQQRKDEVDAAIRDAAAKAKIEMARQREDDEKRAKQAMADREAEFEKKLRQDIAQIVSRMQEQQEHQLEEVSRRATDKEERMRRAVAVLVEKTEQQHQDAMKSMEEEVAFLRSEREERKLQYQKEKEEREERERQYQKESKFWWGGKKRSLTS